ncbi:SpoIID/LytB domain-containing protein [Nocardia sp. NPDC051052]|uniref:SpoIID/LytB domain-containing protein n=1 Tax=Nocardia sp. NPDC051052 TaxID=3364322 RepID=UPI0037A2E336
MRSVLVTGGATLTVGAVLVLWAWPGDTPYRTVAGPGHGRGMSQLGALANAQEGQTAENILAHYYPGATLGTVPANTVAIRLTAQDDATLDTFAGAGLRVAGQLVEAGQAAHLTPLPTGGANVVVTVGCDGDVLWQAATDDPWVYPIDPGPNRPAAENLTLCGGSAYRGALGVATENGAARTVNRVDVEDYLLGVIPAEVQANWADKGGVEALRAQAIAARSYVLAEHRFPFAQSCDTTDCQAYPGTAKEDPRAAAAVASTAGTVLLRDGRILRSEYSSAPGGGEPADIYTFEVGPALSDLAPTVPTAPVDTRTKVAVGESPIDVEYRRIGGAASKVGQPLGPEMALPQNAGRYRMFTNGVIISTATLGTQVVDFTTLLQLVPDPPTPKNGPSNASVPPAPSGAVVPEQVPPAPGAGSPGAIAPPVPSAGSVPPVPGPAPSGIAAPVPSTASVPPAPGAASTGVVIPPVPPTGSVPPTPEPVPSDANATPESPPASVSSAPSGAVVPEQVPPAPEARSPGAIALPVPSVGSVAPVSEAAASGGIALPLPSVGSVPPVSEAAASGAIASPMPSVGSVPTASEPAPSDANATPESAPPAIVPSARSGVAVPAQVPPMVEAAPPGAIAPPVPSAASVPPAPDAASSGGIGAPMPSVGSVPMASGPVSSDANVMPEAVSPLSVSPEVSGAPVSEWIPSRASVSSVIGSARLAGIGVLVSESVPSGGSSVAAPVSSVAGVPPASADVSAVRGGELIPADVDVPSGDESEPSGADEPSVPETAQTGVSTLPVPEAVPSGVGVPPVFESAPPVGFVPPVNSASPGSTVAPTTAATPTPRPTPGIPIPSGNAATRR